MILKDEKISIKQYDQSDHPYHLPDQIDVFSCSMPFLADKVMTILANLLKVVGTDEEMVDKNLEIEAISGVKDASTKAKKIGVGVLVLLHVSHSICSIITYHLLFHHLLTRLSE